jgi:hypothetical protein
LKILGKVWAGRAYVGTNQQELTTCAKKGGQDEDLFLQMVDLGHTAKANGQPLIAG